MLLYTSNIRKHATARMLMYFIPITIIATPLGQITGDHVSTDLVQAIGGVLVTFAAVFELYQKRAVFAQMFCACFAKNKDHISEETNKKPSSYTREHSDKTEGWEDSSSGKSFDALYTLDNKVVSLWSKSTELTNVNANTYPYHLCLHMHT